MCGNTWRVSGSVEDTGFDQLRDLCASAGDDLSLAMGMAGMLTALVFHNRIREAAVVASDCSSLLGEVVDPTVAVTASLAAANAKFQAGEVAQSLRLVQRAIDVCDGDPTKGSVFIGSPLDSRWHCAGSIDSALECRGSVTTSTLRSPWRALPKTRRPT